MAGKKTGKKKKKKEAEEEPKAKRKRKPKKRQETRRVDRQAMLSVLILSGDKRIVGAIRPFFHAGPKNKIYSKGFFQRISLGQKIPREKKGIQIAVTPFVKSFAGSKAKDLETIKRLVREVAELKMENVPYFAEWLYGKRTADDILYTKKIPTIYTFPEGEVIGRGKKEAPAWGCSDQAVALIAALKAKGVKAEYVRTVFGWWDPGWASQRRPHSVVRFSLGKRIYIADPFLLSQGFTEVPLVQQVGEELRKRVKALGGQGLWKIGKDAWSMGIRSIWDFHKHINPDKYQQDQIDSRQSLKTLREIAREKGIDIK